MVHGLGGSAVDFFDSAPLLCDRFFCLILDLPGYGASAKPDASYTPDYFVSFLEELCRELDLKNLRWAGHSMGGMLVLRLACLHPGLVRRAAAICPAGGHQRTGPFRWMLFRSLVSNGDGLRFLTPGMLRLAVGSQYHDRHHPSRPALEARALAQFLGPERKLRERSLVRSAAGLLAHSLLPLLPRITRPVKLITGLHDWVVPQKETDRLMAAMPSNCLKMPEVMDCGHLVPYERPRSLALSLTQFFNPPQAPSRGEPPS
jgi:pimeloyl-ACP methyl ester carboxylesterase